MATFTYTGKTRSGEIVSGERVAEDMDAAVAALRREQVMVTKITPAKTAAKVEEKKKPEKWKKKAEAPVTEQSQAAGDGAGAKFTGATTRMAITRERPRARAPRRKSATNKRKKGRG